MTGYNRMCSVGKGKVFLTLRGAGQGIKGYMAFVVFMGLDIDHLPKYPKVKRIKGYDAVGTIHYNIFRLMSSSSRTIP